MEFETIEVKIPKELLLVVEEEKLEEFMEALSEHGRDVVRYSKEELNEEIRFMIKG